MLRETLLPCILFVNTKTLSSIVGALSTIPVKKAVQGLLNPVELAKEKYLSYQRGSAELIRAVTRGRAFSNTGHLLALRGERCGRQKKQDDANKTKIKGLSLVPQRCLHVPNPTGPKGGGWMSVRGTTVSGIVFSAMEFWDFLCACYNVSPLNIQIKCDGCGTAFGVTHTLSFSTGSLVIARNN